MPDEKRHTLHAYLSSEAHEGLYGFCEEEGLSVSGLLEAFGLGLAAAAGVESHVPAIKISEDTIKATRRIDNARRRRGDR